MDSKHFGLGSIRSPEQSEDCSQYCVTITDEEHRIRNRLLQQWCDLEDAKIPHHEIKRFFKSLGLWDYFKEMEP